MATEVRTLNLDERARDVQMRFGLGALLVSLIAVVMLSSMSVGVGFRALAFVPLFFSSYGMMSALYGVCAFTSVAGRRMTADGAERVGDRSELRAQRRAGAKALGLAFGIAVLATGLFVAAG